MSSESGLTEIIALADLISRTVKDVVAEYTVAGVPMPSLSSTAPGPFDTPETTSPKLARAVRILDAACAQLSFSVGSPGHVVTNKSYGCEEPACMLVATDAKIADLLLDKPAGVHVDELGLKTGIDPGKLGRVLRLLATNHCFTEVQPNVYANNRLSMKLLSSDPVAGVVGHMADESSKACNALNETLKDPETTSSMLPDASAFKRAHGCTIFEFYGLPEQKARGQRFNNAMVGWGAVTSKGTLPKMYPWGSLPEDTIVCDVGGNNGHATVEVLKAFPHLKLIVQDLPKVVEAGPEFLRKDTAMSTALKQRVEYVPLDFFGELPVKACDVYYLRHVLHDWAADECKKILDNVRKAVKPSSRILIHEIVLQHISRESGVEGEFEKAPEPLLPNFGVGRVRAYNQDINMMSSVNSQERTLPQFISMGALSGFDFVKVLEGPGDVALMEFVPRV
ncbi:S-adenosyl-L-methionine-dependent methyltransferase [Mycena rosella]|uniref:S-adenosyl-L-methionine-dependent methyltransferase n=1 Tax=Mycena rosella TaxID=1033263 RepID=A0AAD7FWA9_MYCRO|nr:S-adenosyl-L-methionine-dependent methyltransferase [Mycena rosella]